MDETPPFIGFLPPHMRRTPSPKRMPGAHAQHQWTLGAHQTPSPKRPVRAPPPSPTDRYEQPLPPKGCRGRIISGRWGRIRPLPPTDRYEQPLPPTPTSLYKGVTDRAHCQFFQITSMDISHPLGQVKIILVNFGKLQVSLIYTCNKIKVISML